MTKDFTKAKIIEIFGEYDPERETVLEFAERVADIALKTGRREVVEYIDDRGVGSE